MAPAPALCPSAHVSHILPLALVSKLLPGGPWSWLHPWGMQHPMDTVTPPSQLLVVPHARHGMLESGSSQAGQKDPHPADVMARGQRVPEGEEEGSMAQGRKGHRCTEVNTYHTPKKPHGTPPVAPGVGGRDASLAGLTWAKR